MRIVIGRPTLDKVEAESELSLVKMLSVTKAKSLHYVPCIGSTVIHDARNYLVEEAFKVGFDAILMIDADMIFPPDTLNVLMSHQKDIVGTLYPSRVEDNLVNAFSYRPKKNTYVRSKIAPSTGLQEIDAVGAGVILIRREVFEMIRYPYFFYDSTFSEDINFCHRARAAGYRVYCDTDLDIIHIGKRKYAIQR